MFEQLILPVIIIAVIGLVFGLILAVASKVMAVPVDERVGQVRDQLPGANCGACGYAGCDEYAKAVCAGDAKPNLCAPGGAAAAAAVAEIMGVSAGDVTPKAAFVCCQGTHAVTKDKYVYQGIQTCKACSTLTAGKSACLYGCLGFGDCMASCPYGAIEMVGGIAHVNKELCTGCGACTKACPKHIISLLPKNSNVAVMCSNQNKGAVTRKECSVGCIGCKKCERGCEAGAIKVENNFARIDQNLCTGCGTCIKECPVGAIARIMD